MLINLRNDGREFVADTLCKVKDILNGNFFIEKLELPGVHQLQNIEFEQVLKNGIDAKKLVVFLTPENKAMISGGILSIFSLAQVSRKFNSTVIIATMPSKRTYYKNELFRNEEFVFRFFQVIEVCGSLDSLMIHIPECKIRQFIKNLSKKQGQSLKKVANLQINIMNQNINLIPNIEVINQLRVFTNNITQTVAHHAYATQEVANKYQLPLTLIPPHIDLSKYLPTAWEEKENLIAYSSDQNSHKKDILKFISKALPEYKFIEISWMTFEEYMDVITRAKFTISFGEGFDSYLMQPFYVGSIGVAVYNDTFFPGKDLIDCPNVFESYNDLKNNFCDLVKAAEYSHMQLIKTFRNLSDSLYCYDDHVARAANFYNKQYDFRIEGN